MVEKSGVEKFMVEISWIEKFMVEKSGFEKFLLASGLKSPGLRRSSNFSKKNILIHYSCVLAG